MNLSSRTARRVAAATAATAAAILIPAVALAAPGHRASSAAPAAAPRCASGQLVAWIGVPAGVAAGTFRYQLELSNVSHSTCTLYGYPGVSAYGPHGGQLGSAANRDTTHRAALVTLARGATAHVELSLVDVGVYPPSACGPRQASGLRVYPPGAYRSLKIPYSFRACGTSGPKYLHVTTTIAGTGVPYYSS